MAEQIFKWNAADYAAPIGCSTKLSLSDSQHVGKEGLSGWFRSTWMPYTMMVPENFREKFINDVIDRYLAISPMDSLDNTHVNMVRLEIEAVKH